MSPAREWTLYDACACIEGFGDFADDTQSPDDETMLSAWQFIIDTEAWRHLQGFYGRTCAALIRDGKCHPRPTTAVN